MKKVAIIAAMDKEVSLLEELASAHLIVEKSGIGKVAAALKTAEVIHRHHPDFIINSGVAGGLQPDLNIGDMICGENVCYHDVWCGEPNQAGQVQNFPLYFPADKKLLSLLAPSIKKGLIVSGDQFISEAEKLAPIKENFPAALAVDMESAAIAQTCYIYQTPFISLRLISDVPGTNHHQQQYENFWQNAPINTFEKIKPFLEKLLS